MGKVTTPPVSSASPQNRTIRWGILGTGRIAGSFAEGLRSVPDAALVSVGSRTHASATQFAARFAIPNAYGSYRELAEDPNVDVVYIATPNSRHKEDCLRCIDAGKAVLCEKPLAMNQVEAQEIVDRARGKGVFLMEAMWMRFIPLIQKAREILRAGEIGKPCWLFADFGYPVDPDPRGRFLNLELGGGSLLDRGVYPLSLAYFLFGEPDEITGQATMSATGVDEQSVALLKYREGPQAVLTSTMQTFGTNRATVIGTHGQIEIEAPFFQTTRISVTRFPAPPPRPSSARPIASSSFRDSALLRSLRRCKRAVDRLRDKDPNRVVYAVPLEGNGYNYEAAEVGKCLRAASLESPLMPGAESVAISKASG